MQQVHRRSYYAQGPHREPRVIKPVKTHSHEGKDILHTLLADARNSEGSVGSLTPLFQADGSISLKAIIFGLNELGGK